MRSHMWLVALLVLSVVCAQHALGQTPVLVAGGSFTTAGGVSVNRVAQWDGTNWSTLGSGMDNAVSALTVFNNQLVAGGAFTTAGSISASRIAQWDGLTWSAFSNSELMDGSVYALTVFNAMLVIGGAFTTAGGISANYIAQWNGTGWAALGNGIGGVVALDGGPDIIVPAGQYVVLPANVVHMHGCTDDGPALQLSLMRDTQTTFDVVCPKEWTGWLPATGA